MASVNYFALIVAGIANMAIGFLWYGPLFGKVWMNMMNFSSEHMKMAQEKGMGKTYAIAFVGALVMAYVVSQLVYLWGAYNVVTALQVAITLWLGFIATSFLGTVLWEGKSWKLYTLNISYYLVVLIAQSLILTYWV